MGVAGSSSSVAALRWARVSGAVCLEVDAVLGAESYRAGVVVLGDRGHGALPGLLVGVTRVALAAGAGLPVVVGIDG